MISGRLGLDHNRVLGSRYSFPLMVQYLTQRGGNLVDSRERDKLLYWYVHTFLWGRYAGSTETRLSQDLAAIEDLDGATEQERSFNMKALWDFAGSGYWTPQLVGGVAQRARTSSGVRYVTHANSQDPATLWGRTDQSPPAVWMRQRLD